MQAGDGAMIGGFIITGNAPKRVIVRAIGPSLQQAGVAGALSDPTLTLRGADGSTIGVNDNWKEDSIARAEIERSGVAPREDAEAALVATLSPGAYTATVAGAKGATGTAVVEVYDVETGSESKLANISTRGVVGSGDNVMIGGFVLGGEGGGKSKVIIRAIGPSLAAAGLSEALSNPTLSLHDGNGALASSNDDWKQTQADDIQRSGVAPQDDREAALIAELEPGAYTAVVSGSGSGAGAALVELYHLQ